MRNMHRITPKPEEPIIYQPTVNRAKSIGYGSKIGAFCDIGKDVVIGENCLIQCHVSISNGWTIGNSVFIGPGVRFANDKYMIGFNLKQEKLQPGIVKDFVRIGMGALIGAGVILGKGCWIGQGANVIHNVDERICVTGNPARFYNLVFNIESRDIGVTS